MTRDQASEMMLINYIGRGKITLEFVGTLRILCVIPVIGKDTEKL
jgi:hypothetical protein